MLVKKREPEKQTGVRVGNIIVLAQHDEQALKHSTQHLLTHLYQVHQTEHFVVCQKTARPSIVMHTFGCDSINADLICFTERELAPLSLITSAREYGALLFALLAAPFPLPRDQSHVWRSFCLNTLDLLRRLIADPSQQETLPLAHILPFAVIYRRVFELCRGQSVLDVGSCFGFLPILFNERLPGMRVVGCDINPDLLAMATDLAQVTHAHQASFTFGDVLATDFSRVGHFDTVIALHLLEHLPEEQLSIALSHLLQVTSQRLIIAVPYEEQAQILYEHAQVFTLEKLHRWGTWCVERLGGAGTYWCEEVMGGMLIIERWEPPK